ncbi:MAG: hypothetical protein J0L62_06130 [Bacteroidetes bacterium]|nr:hypothetical protein [Bacteroidota bacterium]
MPTYKIGAAGENAVLKDLTDHGFTTSLLKSTISEPAKIEANKQKTRIIVHVKVAVLPEKPHGVSQEEENKIIIYASRMGAIAYEAKVQLDHALNSTEINYRILL